MTHTPDTTAAVRQRLAETQASLDRFIEDERQLASELAAAESQSPSSEFAAAIRGTTSRAIGEIRADHERAARLVSGGRETIAMLKMTLRHAEADARAAAEAAMTPAGALAHARAGLARLDPAACGRRLDELEEEMAAVDERRRETGSAVTSRRQSLNLLAARHSSGMSPAAASRYALEKADRERIEQDHAKHTEQARELADEHAQLLSSLRTGLSAAMAHVARMLDDAASRTSNLAKRRSAAARLAREGRIDPASAAVDDWPFTEAELADLQMRTTPILAVLSRRKLSARGGGLFVSARPIPTTSAGGMSVL